MDFAEFALQFQRRTEKRLADFEKVMVDSQRKMEETAKHYAAARENMERPVRNAPRGDYSAPRPRKAQLQKRQVRAVLQSRAQYGSGFDDA